MSKDNTAREKRRVTRTGGVPQVEWQTGRREGQPVRIDNVERESTTAEDVIFQDDDDEIYEDPHENDTDEEGGQEKSTNKNQKDDNEIDSENDQDVDDDDVSTEYVTFGTFSQCLNSFTDVLSDTFSISVLSCLLCSQFLSFIEVAI